MSAPMLGIYALKKIPTFLSLAMIRLALETRENMYVPGGSDYKPGRTLKGLPELFSSDEERAKIHDAWMEFDPDLQVGSVTYKWLYHAVRSCKSLIEKACRSLKHVTHIHLQGAKHEILMERDEIRDEFLKSFDELIKINILDKKDTITKF